MTNLLRICSTSSKVKKLRLLRGFTLIELLVVIAILGILASAVLVAINPLEQLARGRDAGRKTTVQQLGNSVQSYYTSQGAVYPTVGLTWMSTVQTAGELKTLPSNPSGTGYSTGCNSSATLDQNGYCYNSNTTDAVVFTRAESKSSTTSAGCNPNTQTTWIVWSSADGKTGLACVNNGSDPAIGITGLK